MEVSPQSSKVEGTLTPGKPGPVFYANVSKGEDGLMVTGAITPLSAQVVLVAPQ